MNRRMSYESGRDPSYALHLLPTKSLYLKTFVNIITLPRAVLTSDGGPITHDNLGNYQRDSDDKGRHIGTTSDRRESDTLDAGAGCPIAERGRRVRVQRKGIPYRQLVTTSAIKDIQKPKGVSGNSETGRNEIHKQRLPAYDRESTFPGQGDITPIATQTHARQLDSRIPAHAGIRLRGGEGSRRPTKALGHMDSKRSIAMAGKNERNGAANALAAE